MISAQALSDLTKYINETTGNIQNLLVKKDATQTECIMGSLASLIEEVGEFSSDIRQSQALSFSPKKVAAFDKQNMYQEWVDVLICTLILLNQLGIKGSDDLDEYIYQKIQKNQSRGY